MQKGQCFKWNRGGSVNTKETTYVVSVLHIGVHYIDFLMQKWNRGGSVNTKETTYVVGVLHIGVHYIDFLMQKGQCLAVS